MTEFVSATNGLVVEMPPKTEACGGICRVRNPVEPPEPPVIAGLIELGCNGEHGAIMDTVEANELLESLAGYEEGVPVISVGGQLFYYDDNEGTPRYGAEDLPGEAFNWPSTLPQDDEEGYAIAEIFVPGNPSVFVYLGWSCG